jgi:hypothetical protein
MLQKFSGLYFEKIWASLSWIHEACISRPSYDVTSSSMTSCEFYEFLPTVLHAQTQKHTKTHTYTHTHTNKSHRIFTTSGSTSNFAANCWAIWEVAVPNFHPETGNFMFFFLIYSPSSQIPEESPKLGKSHFLPHSFPFIFNSYSSNRRRGWRIPAAESVFLFNTILKSENRPQNQHVPNFLQLSVINSNPAA